MEDNYYSKLRIFDASVNAILKVIIECQYNLWYFLSNEFYWHVFITCYCLCTLLACNVLLKSSYGNKSSPKYLSLL